MLEELGKIKDLVLMMDWNLTRVNFKFDEIEKVCKHDFEDFFITDVSTCRCRICRLILPKSHRTKCKNCNMILCRTCSRIKFNYIIKEDPNDVKIEVATSNKEHLGDQVIDQLLKRIKDLELNNSIALDKLKQQNKDLEKENARLKLELELASLRREKEQEIELEQEANEINELEEEEEIEELNLIKNIKNNLLNLEIELIFEDNNSMKFVTLIDTGATRCLLLTDRIPNKYLEDPPYIGEVTGITGSPIELKKKLTKCHIKLKYNKYIMPLTWVTKPLNSNNIKERLVLGMNFITSELGGIIVRNKSVMIFKKSEYINTTDTLVLREGNVKISNIEEDSEIQLVSENIEEYLEELDEEILDIDFDNPKIAKILKELEELQIIGSNPLKFWNNNKVKYKLEII